MLIISVLWVRNSEVPQLGGSDSGSPLKLHGILQAAEASLELEDAFLSSLVWLLAGTSVLSHCWPGQQLLATWGSSTGLRVSTIRTWQVVFPTVSKQGVSEPVRVSNEKAIILFMVQTKKLYPSGLPQSVHQNRIIKYSPHSMGGELDSTFRREEYKIICG